VSVNEGKDLPFVLQILGRSLEGLARRNQNYRLIILLLNGEFPCQFSVFINSINLGSKLWNFYKIAPATLLFFLPS
jgi:hypothetical protein